MESSTPAATTATTEPAIQTPPAAKSPAGSRGSAQFFYGTATGVVLATVIGAVGFFVMRAKYEDSLKSLKADRENVVAESQQWKAAYDSQTAWVSGRNEAFDKDWESAQKEVPILRRLMLLSYRPVPASEPEYRNKLREHYDKERSDWWQELEATYGPSMPEEIDAPNPAKSDAFFVLGLWSRLMGNENDTRDALAVAMLWAAPGNDAHVHRAMGHYRYRIPAWVKEKATPQQLDLLAPFVGQWVTSENRDTISGLEAAVRDGQ